MIQNNLINIIFRGRQVRHTKDILCRAAVRHNVCNSLVSRIKAATSLTDLMRFHKEAWGMGYNNVNLGPDPYGMFRTKDIATMTSDEVFLGGIWGLSTKPLSYWEKVEKDHYGSNGVGLNEDVTYFEILAPKYRSLLVGNIMAIDASDVKILAEGQRHNYREAVTKR